MSGNAKTQGEICHQFWNTSLPQGSLYKLILAMRHTHLQLARYSQRKYVLTYEQVDVVKCNVMNSNVHFNDVFLILAYKHVQSDVLLHRA